MIGPLGRSAGAAEGEEEEGEEGWRLGGLAEHNATFAATEFAWGERESREKANKTSHTKSESSPLFRGKVKRVPVDQTSDNARHFN